MPNFFSMVFQPSFSGGHVNSFVGGRIMFVSLVVCICFGVPDLPTLLQRSA